MASSRSFYLSVFKVRHIKQLQSLQSEVADWSAYRTVSARFPLTCLFSLVVVQRFMSSHLLLGRGGRLGRVIMRSAALTGLCASYGETLQKKTDAVGANSVVSSLPKCRALLRIYDGGTG